MKKILKTLFSIVLIVNCQLSTVNCQDTTYMRQTLRQLTSDKMHGRGYSYRGDSIAADFIRKELKRLKIKPLADNYYQNYTFSAHSMEGPVSLKINGKRLVPYTDYRIPAWSKSTWGDYKLIELPAEVLTDATRMKKFLNKYKGRLDDVFVYIDATTFKPADERENKLYMEQLHGIQLRNPFNSRGVIVGVNELGTYSPANNEQQHNYAYIEVLAYKMPTKLETLNCHFFTQFHPDYKTQNVYGYIPGDVDTMIVFTAHYDHLGTMGDSTVFYGAHDNASGVATLLDMAREASYSKPHYTTVFCFFSGEEAGLKGSQYAAQHPLFDFSKVRLLINIDMFCGGNEGLMIFNAKDERVKQYVDRLDNLNKVLQIAPEIRRRENRPNSDHWWFSQHVPAIFILSMGQRYGGYHDPLDTCERCGLENYINYITLISALAL